MRILMVHNFYQQAGGEDIVFAAEMQMLRDNGHEVFQFTAHNNSLQGKSSSKIARDMIWSSDAKSAIATKIAEVQPELVHFHNTFMSISPAAYYACKEANLPVIQTLHNYRMVCPKATLYRSGANCMDCFGKPMYLPAIQHSCYRDSRLQSAAVALMLTIHQGLKTYEKQVDKFICLSEGARRILIDGGLNPEKMLVKGNFLEQDPGYSPTDEQFFVFLGRLVPEKGLLVLLEAWKQLPNIPLKIVGDGDLREEVIRTIQENNMQQVEFLGQLSHDKAIEVLKRSSALIVPSQWHEPFGMVAIEAFGCGKPVIASKIGALGDIIEDAKLGLHFEAENPSSLAEKVKWLWEHPEERQAMARMARQAYESKYTSAANYQQLMEIYQGLLRAAI